MKRPPRDHQPHPPLDPPTPDIGAPEEDHLEDYLDWLAGHRELDLDALVPDDEPPPEPGDFCWPDDPDC